MGLGSMIKCTVGQNTYLLIRSTGAGQAAAFLNSFSSRNPKAHGAPYVAGPNWAVAGEPRGDENPTRAMAESIQKKIGGTIVTIP